MYPNKSFNFYILLLNTKLFNFFQQIVAKKLQGCASCVDHSASIDPLEIRYKKGFICLYKKTIILGEVVILLSLRNRGKMKVSHKLRIF